MIKEMAWKMFKNTGNINTFLELKQLENYENLNLEKEKTQEKLKEGQKKNK